MPMTVDGKQHWPQLNTVKQAIEAYHTPITKAEWSKGARQNERHLAALLYIKACLEVGIAPTREKALGIAKGKIKG